LLLPAALQEWLPDDNLAYFIYDVVEREVLAHFASGSPMPGKLRPLASAG